MRNTAAHQEERQALTVAIRAIVLAIDAAAFEVGDRLTHAGYIYKIKCRHSKLPDELCHDVVHSLNQEGQLRTWTDRPQLKSTPSAFQHEITAQKVRACR